MKTVFSNSTEVIHKFVERSQSEGRSGNVFFENDKIYSYGRHYLLAEFIKNQKNDIAIMINDRGYSNTTSKHISEVRQGSRQFKQFLTMSTTEKNVLSQLEFLIDKLQKAKKPEIYIFQARTLFASFCEFLDWKGENIDSFPEIKAAFNVFNTKDIKSYFETKQAAIKEREKIEAKKALKAQKESLKKFFNYEVNYCYHMIEDFCRISKDSLFVETSQGVKVSTNEAKLLYKLIKAGKDIRGHKIGSYIVIALNGQLKIGCHKINHKNMVEIGEKLLLL
jgi:hypothetical protein